MIPDQVHGKVVAFFHLREVLPGVVDNLVGADRPDHLEIARAADAGELGAERTGDLHGEGADAAGCAVYQHPLPGPDSAIS